MILATRQKIRLEATKMWAGIRTDDPESLPYRSTKSTACTIRRMNKLINGFMD